MPPPGRFFDPYGSRFGSPRCPENGDVSQSCKSERKSPLSGWKAVILWLRGLDLNQRPPGYEAVSRANRSHFGFDLCFLPLFA